MILITCALLLKVLMLSYSCTTCYEAVGCRDSDQKQKSVAQMSSQAPFRPTLRPRVGFYHIKETTGV
jgi:hypothetical protein